MLLKIPSVLSPDQLRGAQEMLRDAPFVDGRLSAGKVARTVKNNQEVQGDAAVVQRLNDLVMGALVSHPVYRAAAMPLQVAAPYYARYTEGMAYGDHIDDPIMRAEIPYRSDISITIFLSEPADYDGGELVVRTSFGENAVKLPAGDAVMYPSSSLHHVSEVTRGARLVAVTWVQSLVRSPEKRELLYDLYRVREAMLRDQPGTEETGLVDKSYVNLVRLWSEF